MLSLYESGSLQLLYLREARRMAEQLLKNIYYNPSNPGSYGGKERLQRAIVEETGSLLSDAKVNEWLSEQDAYTLHKPVRKHFPRNRVFSTHPLSQFQADLCDMQSLADKNDGNRYMLTVIDIFSKLAYVRVLKNKSGAEVTRAFESILKAGGAPKKVQTDGGKEFFNKTFQKLMNKYNIVHFATGSDLKASVVERFNRTLKERMWRYFTAHNTNRYTDIVQDLVNGYNHSYHKTIRMKPSEVSSENSFQVFKNMYGLFPLRRKKKMTFKFLVGDLVRISKLRGVFDKKYEQGFSSELFTVTECLPRIPPVYKLKDYDGDLIEGSFYEKELQKVQLGKDKVFHVEEILDQKREKGKKWLLVRWKNWPQKFNSWVLEQDVVEATGVNLNP
jgi:transposase-like protein